MRSFAVAAAAIAVTTSSGWLQPAQAQQWLQQAIPLEARTHDFGTVARAANTEHRFEIKNTSKQEMHLRSVRASCGCTTPIIETQVIPPGQTGTILARFNTGTFTGQKQATLTVTIDRPQFTELQLNVRGYIRSDIVLNPGEINFGEVPHGESKTVEVNLDYAGRGDWKLVDVVSPGDFLDVQFEETARAAGRTSYKITATLAPDTPIGFLKNHLVLKTNDRNLTSVPLVLSGDIQSPIQVSPQEVALGSVKPGTPVPQRLAVKAREPFRILDITCDDAEVRFDPVESARSAQLVNLMIVPKPRESDGLVQSHLVIRTDLIDEPIRLPFSFEAITHSPAESVVQVP